MKKRILFVDDQPQILSGLRRMLHSFRDQWEMLFVESARAALEVLERLPCDAVVTDMRMPGMDGASLLRIVQEKHPQTVRLILSGQADEETTLRSVGPSHQYLSKPCDAKTLETVLVRAMGLRERLADSKLTQLVSQVTTLPSVPGVYTTVIKELNSPDASMSRVGELISQDLAMSVKLLQLVNSSYFGVSRKVETPTRAAAILGVRLVKALVLSAGIFSQAEKLQLSGLSLDQLSSHCMAVSVLAQKIAADFGGDSQLVEDALLAGMMHDIGQLVLAANLREQYTEIVAYATAERLPLYRVEIDRLGTCHANVGAYLLGLWGFQDAIAEAAAYHHEPHKSCLSQFTPLTAVHVANVLINEDANSLPYMVTVDLDQEYLDRLGLADRIHHWRELAKATRTLTGAC